MSGPVKEESTEMKRKKVLTERKRGRERERRIDSAREREKKKR